MSSLPAAVADLEEYTGTGTVYVIENGRVVIEYTSPAEEADGLVIDDVSEHFLISSGATATLLPPWESTPPGTTSKTKLNGTGSSAIGQYQGTLSVTENADGSWHVAVVGGSLITSFYYDFNFLTEVVPGTCCTQVCGEDWCNSNAEVCWCFCGVFGEPHCIGLFQAGAESLGP